MVPSESLPDELDAVARQAFSRRIMRNALVHRVGQGLDASYVYRLQGHGLMRDATSPDYPEAILAILADKKHPQREYQEDGPLIFIREQSSISILEVHSLILHPDATIRVAALSALQAASDAVDPWLTNHSLRELELNSERLKSELDTEWKPAGIHLATVLRDDYLRLLGCLLTSFIMQHEDGIHEYLQKALRPQWKELFFLSPDVISPMHQKEDIRNKLDKLSNQPTLTSALTGYLKYCGHLPLASEMSSAELARRWQNKHEGHSCTNNDLYEWAVSCKTPVAKYHALIIVLDRSKEGVSAIDKCWTREIHSLLNAYGEKGRDSDVEDDEGLISESTWRLFCEIGSSFVRQIESAHPCQEGDRLASLAWWLATKLVKVLVESKVKYETVLNQCVAPESGLSESRWMIARTPTVPSEFRLVSLHFSSVWSISLIPYLTSYCNSNEHTDKPTTIHDDIRQAIIAYIATSPLGNPRRDGQAVLSFQENSQIPMLASNAEYFADDQKATLQAVLSIRSKLWNWTELELQLNRLEECDPEEDFLTLMILRDVLYSTSEADEVISGWLNRPEVFKRTLFRISKPCLNLLGDSLIEFQLRQPSETASRLQHMFAYSIEEAEEQERASYLFACLLQLSISGGVVSPIQRAMKSKWGHSFSDSLNVWRGNLVQLSMHCEPWVRGRIRSTCATISRICLGSS